MTAYKGPYGAFYMIQHTPKPEKDKVISCVCQSQKCDCPEPCEHCDSGDCNCKRKYKIQGKYG